jgi:hypothetical protein
VPRAVPHEFSLSAPPIGSPLVRCVASTLNMFPRSPRTHPNVATTHTLLKSDFDFRLSSVQFPPRSGATLVAAMGPLDECIIPNYRLRKHDLEVYLSYIFPSVWVRARVRPVQVLENSQWPAFWLAVAVKTEKNLKVMFTNLSTRTSRRSTIITS